MNWRSEGKALLVAVLVFTGLYYLPVGSARFDGAITEALALTRWYAREHVLLCLIPAFYWLQVSYNHMWYAIALAIFVVFTHRSNIRNIMSGTEHRFEKARIKNWFA